ncbi:ferrienterochelin and colicins outer membrane receptor [Pseudoalteromonas espejiana DSM 9414]|uniref:Ligand-gated channel protein n=1 Tax=Pseudoalteromonas espejiana TaxID=28107 RepID=A0A510XTP7_9GAMM|nr:TonB-dependent receptor [Pseudoalteromonas espejiana]ASM51930.1 ferrienterochelin and colicins outer membrane receptor [Pseudoalteromonas espejiana DSM 9414]GEK54383.1 ligand-gated channel protein [Pseudoalteromonas espejiana]
MTLKTTLVLPLIAVAPLYTLANVNNDIETIVVTASGFEQTLAQAPASITLISRKQLENRAYKDLTDALNDVAGVTVTGGGSRQDISVRGMPAQYTAILVDGKKQSGRESQPSGSGGFEQDWLPPLDAIERIEVVRGPMSTLYGSDAIGGVINVITRKSYENWHANLRVETTQQSNSDSGDEYQGQIYVAGPLIKDLLSINLSALYQEREEDAIERGYGEKELTSYSGTLHLTATKQDVVSFEYSEHDQKRSSTSGLSLPSRNSSTETNNNRRSMSLSHKGDYNWGAAHSYIQQESVENEGREITIDNTLANTQWSIALNNHHVTIGGAFEQEKLNDKTTNAASITEIDNKQWSVFSEDEWSFHPDFTLTAGLRLDDNEQFDSHFSPRLYGVWNINSQWTFKSGIATGYRAPDLRELSPNWVQTSRGGDLFGNAELEPETSVSKEAALYFANNTFQTNVTLFHNSFKDKINTVLCPITVCGDETDRYNINIDKAVTYGAELNIEAQLSTDIMLSSSYSYTFSEQRSGDNKGQPLTQIPEHLASLNINWDINNALNAWARTNYRSKESEPASVTSRLTSAPSITTTDLGSAWKINDNVKVMFGIYNLFNKSTTYDEYGYVEDGRRYWFAIDTKL